MALNWKISPVAGAAEAKRIELVGDITDTADLTPLLAEFGGSVVIDLSGIGRINSLGVRIWVQFIGEATSRGTVRLERCSSAIVGQLNMISRFAGSASVRSVLLNYQCESCDHESVDDLLLSPSAQPIPEGKPCPACGGNMSFDDDPESYLAFTQS